MTPATFYSKDYPTEEWLDALAKAEAVSSEQRRAIAKAVIAAWNYGAPPIDEHGILRLATGGWSGNESIIGALQKNWLWWAMCWQSSHHGGLYFFQFDSDAPDGHEMECLKRAQARGE